uniref:hypothetical protein n=1 Tax=Gonatophragmium mori TaxID=2966219 RepID=UPI0023D7EFC7|nr:hypothetical protein P2Z26_mgp13 [Gonatophragmium mori]WCZ71167.1 hypothetical protein [Gonatophragmium mori]
MVFYKKKPRLSDNRYISRSLLKYGHNNFSVVVLYILDDKIDINIIVQQEQKYIDLYQPALNLNPKADSSLGFKHSDKTKKLLSEFKTGKKLSEDTKNKLSLLFSKELNPFWSKAHSKVSL